MATEDIRIDVEMDSTDVIRELQKINSALDGFGRNMSNVPKEPTSAFKKFFTGVNQGFQLAFGASVMGMATDALKSLVVDTVKVGAEFEQSMAKVGAIMGANTTEMNQLSETARQFGANTKWSATEASEALSYMGMAGWSAEESMAGLGGVLNLATASGLDLARTSDIVTDNLTAFGLTAQDTGRYTDALAYASANANVNVDNMGEALKYVAPVAESVGISMEETVAMVAKLGDAGIKGSQAGTTLRAVLANLSSGAGEAGKAMEELGINVTDVNGNMRPMSSILSEISTKTADMTEVQKANIAKMIAGKTAMSGFLALLNSGGASVAGFTNELRLSGGTAQTMADTMSNTVQGSMLNLKSAMEELKITMFEANKDGIMQVVQGLTVLINKLTGTKSEAQKFAEEWGLAMSDTTANNLENVKMISDSFNMIDLAIQQTGSITKGQTDQMIANMQKLQEDSIMYYTKLKDDQLAILDEKIASTEGKEKEAYEKQRENFLTTSEEKLQGMRDANAKEIEELQKYLNDEGVISEAGYKVLKDLKDKYLKDKINATVQNGEELKSANQRIMDNEQKVTKENYESLRDTIKTNYDEQVKMAGQKRQSLVNEANTQFRLLGTISQSEYDQLIKDADNYYKQVEDGANTDYTRAMNKIISEVERAGGIVDDETLDLIDAWKATKSELSKGTATGKVNTKSLSNARGEMEKTEKKWWNLWGLLDSRRSWSAPKMVGGGGGRSRSRRSVNFMAIEGAGLSAQSTSNNYSVRFDGNYSFKDRSDIDYMLSEAGKRVRRKR